MSDRYDNPEWKSASPRSSFEVTPMSPLAIGCCVIIGLVVLLGFAYLVEVILHAIYGV